MSKNDHVTESELKNIERRVCEECYGIPTADSNEFLTRALTRVIRALRQERSQSGSFAKAA